ncbi:sugar kinase [Waterburya agarophytonicola K14]|uniref:Sugar kinase n=1 Tax=Waterburya agarophytonicola KI4 TaxID=2874699 RepID=A0A964FF41_9CYAN|nr:sugar kinase [Waterburya agarophytonicola]MCC0176622.1 sugar kinase [Waterburya agarophytonicola KI4]
MKYQGLFVGLTTLDCIYLSSYYLQPNQKIVAQDYLTAAGGPATNAAVAFSYFGNASKLLTVLGQHSLNNLIRGDLDRYEIEILDLIPQQSVSPPVSSIIVYAETGERSIISINALKSQAKRSQIPQNILKGIHIILIDGHQIDASLALAKIAKDRQIPVVIDAGSWKPGLETVLREVDYAICSDNFHPPECNNTKEVFDFLQTQGIKQIAITQGKQPIQYLEKGKIHTMPVPTIKAIDTLGAGDIFHGAFCNYILQKDFATALKNAAVTASKSCQYFGTREWLTRPLR